MKHNRFLLSVFMFFTMGLAISYAQDKEHCIILELSSGEMQEVYLSAHPRLTQNNDKVNLVTDVGTTELGTTSIKKVYTSLATLKLVYKVDGEVYKSFLHCEGVSLPPIPQPEKEGYTFSGWDSEPTVMPSQDVTVSGSFNINKYKLTYKVDGEDYKSYDVDFGSAITPETAPTKEGFTFSGWSEIPGTMPAQDVIVTGTFAINSYTITYMVDGVIYSTESAVYGATITPPTIESRPGSFFTWDDYPETMPAHDITITGTHTTGISNISNGNGIVISGGNIYLSGLKPYEVVNIYNVAGELLLSAQATAQGDLTISNSALAPGINIIKNNSQTYKITKQ